MASSVTFFFWHKPSVEAVSSDSVMAAPEQLSLDKAGGDCSLTLRINHADSHAPNALSEHATVLSTKGCDTLAADMVPKGQDCLAPSGVPETSSSVVTMCGASTSAEPKCRDPPVQMLPPGNSATSSAKNQDSFVGRVAPIVHDGLLRTISGSSSSPAQEVCKSSTPTAGCPGYASLAQVNTSQTHGVSAPGVTSKGYESAVPSLSLGNSKSASVKQLNSAPRMTPEGQKFLSLGIASQSPAPRDLAKCQAGLTLVAIPPVHAPGHGKSPSIKIEGHDFQAPSITPKGNGAPASSKVPKLHEPMIADTSIKGCDSLALSITPNGHDGPASSNKTPKRQESAMVDTMPESSHSQCQSIGTKSCDAPKPRAGEPKKEQAVVTGSQGKSSVPGLDASSHVTGAASALIALSSLREKAGR